MKKSVLRKLFDGEICPSADIIPKETKYRETSFRLGDLKKEMVAILNQEQLQLWNEIDTSLILLSDLNHFAMFEAGFKLGAMLAIEATQNISIFVDEIATQSGK